MVIDPNGSAQEQQVCVDDPPPESMDERRRRWVCLLRSQHYEPVIFDVLNDELPKYTSSRIINPTDVITHMRECALILASAPDIFFAAVEGNLVSRIIHEADLQAEYAAIKNRAHHQPSIYIHLLADKEGQAPSPIQYLRIRDMVQDYLEENLSEHAYHIDNITSTFVSLETSTQRYRKYLSTSRTDRSPKRVATLQRLCTGITHRCSQISLHLQSRPLPQPPTEVGYALNAHKRMAQHCTHQSSNYIMNLVEDICAYLFRTELFSQHFTMHQFVVYSIFRPSQAAIAEVFCSGLLQCWVDQGGFNAYPAGRSVASEKKVGADGWQEHERFTRQGSPLEERMEVMKKRAEIWRSALDWEGERAKDSATVEEEKSGDEMEGIEKAKGKAG